MPPSLSHQSTEIKLPAQQKRLHFSHILKVVIIFMYRVFDCMCKQYDNIAQWLAVCPGLFLSNLSHNQEVGSYKKLLLILLKGCSLFSDTFYPEKIRGYYTSGGAGIKIVGRQRGGAKNVLGGKYVKDVQSVQKFATFMLKLSNLGLF